MMLQRKLWSGLAATLGLVALFAISCSSPLSVTSGAATASKGLNLPAQRTFVHPGAADSKAKLDFIKAKVAAGAQPWTGQFNQVLQLATTYNRASAPLASGGGNENDMKADGKLAYANAIAWWITGNATYAANAAAVLNTWAATFNGYPVPGVGQGSQDQLDCAWTGSLLGPAAELMRGYAGLNLAAVQNMFKTKFYPALNQMSGWNGNNDLTQIEAMMSIAVFNEDTAELNAAVARAEYRVPNYFYLVSDGPRNDAGVWFNPSKWVDGLTQETCRDYGHHSQFAMAATLKAMEVAYNQGVDLYGEFQTRMVAAMELLGLQLSTGNMQGVCASAATNDIYNTFEIGYNHYHNVVGLAMPNSLAEITNKVRVASNSDWDIFYETLLSDMDGAGTTTTTVPVTTTTVPVTTTTVPVTTTTVPVTTTTVPVTGVSLPGTVTASAYTAITGTLKTEPCADLGGGLDVGYTSVGGYLQYKVNVAAAGSYTAAYRVASALGGSFDVLIDGTKVDTIAVASTGGWQNWVTVNGNGSYTLAAGAHTLQITVAATAFNVNWYAFTAGGATTTTVPVTTTTIPVTTTTVPVTTTTVPVTTTTVPSAGGVKVAYTKSDWGNGCTSTLTLTNTGTAPVSNWQLAFSFAGNQTVTSFWSSTVVQTGKNLVVTPVGYNSTIAPGASVNFGFNVSYSGTNADPVNFVVTSK